MGHPLLPVPPFIFFSINYHGHPLLLTPMCVIRPRAIQQLLWLENIWWPVGPLLEIRVLRAKPELLFLLIFPYLIRHRIAVVPLVVSDPRGFDTVSPRRGVANLPESYAFTPFRKCWFFFLFHLISFFFWLRSLLHWLRSLPNEYTLHTHCRYYILYISYAKFFFWKMQNIRCHLQIRHPVVSTSDTRR